MRINTRRKEDKMKWLFSILIILFVPSLSLADYPTKREIKRNIRDNYEIASYAQKYDHKYAMNEIKFEDRVYRYSWRRYRYKGSCSSLNFYASRLRPNYNCSPFWWY